MAQKEVKPAEVVELYPERTPERPQIVIPVPKELQEYLDFAGDVARVVRRALELAAKKGRMRR